MTETQSPDHPAILEALSRLVLPCSPGITASDALVAARLDTQEVFVHLQLGFPVDGPDDYREALLAELRARLAPLAPRVNIQLDWFSPAVQPLNSQASVAGVKNIVAVASGKGGVGKSTTSANLALALAACGATVGVLDADIYGPSQALMFGVADRRPEMHAANQMRPILTAGGVQLISMGNLVTEQTPMVWRGPMVSGALQQLLRNTHWPDIDYLIVDMPPGTGDIQLTLSQTVPVSGAVIVTTPQDIALLDAKKGIEMFRKVDIPVLGVVENMATHICSQCGHQEAIFGEGGGQSLADQYQVDILGRLPLALSIREQTDRGVPPVLSDPRSAIGAEYISLARRVAARLWAMARTGEQGPVITIE